LRFCSQHRPLGRLAISHILCGKPHGWTELPQPRCCPKPPLCDEPQRRTPNYIRTGGCLTGHELSLTRKINKDFEVKGFAQKVMSIYAMLID
jgi:hypothetical protein